MQPEQREGHDRRDARADEGADRRVLRIEPEVPEAREQVAESGPGTGEAAFGETAQAAEQILAPFGSEDQLHGRLDEGGGREHADHEHGQHRDRQVDRPWPRGGLVGQTSTR